MLPLSACWVTELEGAMSSGAANWQIDLVNLSRSIQ
jgi:hypothetical protein